MNNVMTGTGWLPNACKLVPDPVLSDRDEVFVVGDVHGRLDWLSGTGT